MRFSILVLLYVYSLIIVSCNNTPFDNNETKPQPEEQSKDPNNSPPQINAQLMKFLELAPIIESIKFGLGMAFTFDIKMTNHYKKTVPPSAILMDYDNTGHGFSPWILIAANIPQAMEKNLPKSVRKALQDHNLLGQGLVDIRFVVQWNSSVGESGDHDLVPTTTRIDAHGWVDPDAPVSYAAGVDRVNREFLLGIYETLKDISTAQLPLGQLVTTRIIVHNNAFSPRSETSKILLGSNDDSQAFWIVVIDNKNPSGQTKALANLIWVLDTKKWNAARRILYDFKAKKPRVNNFGEFRSGANSSADFQGWHGLNLLNDLLK